MKVVIDTFPWAHQVPEAMYFFDANWDNESSEFFWRRYQYTSHAVFGFPSTLNAATSTTCLTLPALFVGQEARTEISAQIYVVWKYPQLSARRRQNLAEFRFVPRIRSGPRMRSPLGLYSHVSQAIK